MPLGRSIATRRRARTRLCRVTTLQDGSLLDGLTAHCPQARVGIAAPGRTPLATEHGRRYMTD